MTEILAPAGSFESLKAAVRCGANAVYFGSKMFNARRNAENFSDEELKEAVEYCHSRNVKVYITLNTLVKDSETDSLKKEILFLASAGVDAFIMQDFGAVSVVKELCPDMPLHASTQMSIQSPYGVRFLDRLGFTRVVVPRELSRKEIEDINRSSDIEIEAFVHGALCMCLSGQCLMSSVLGGRSGNRGLCAQPCRLPFGVNSKGGNNLSLKDLSLIERIPELEKSGVDSLKIEGRMKRPEYVAASVTACKNAINKTYDKKISDALSAVFSRSGFTSGYFDSVPGRDMFGIRTKDDVESASSVLSELSHLYDNENPLIPVKMKFTMRADERPSLEVSGCGKTVSAAADIIPSPALNKEITADDAAVRLSKCGGTQFYPEKVDCDIDSGLNLPASVMNSLRRDALSALESRIAEKEPYEINGYGFKPVSHRAGNKKLYLRFLDADKIPGIPDGIDRVIIPLDTPDETAEKIASQCAELAAEIPVNIFSDGERFIKELRRLKCHGVTLAVADNVDGIEIAKEAGLPFATGFGMNICNSVSLDFFEKAGAEDCLLSCECTADEIASLGGNVPRGAVVYGRIPLMVTRNCPIKNKLKCSGCKRESELVDRMNIRFPVRCKYSCSYILNSRPICMYDKKDGIRNTDFDLLYFTTETKDECLEIIKAYKKGSHPDYEYTRGLYGRNVL